MKMNHAGTDTAISSTRPHQRQVDRNRQSYFNVDTSRRA
jgi:hypothetical protein